MTNISNINLPFINYSTMNPYFTNIQNKKFSLIDENSKINFSGRNSSSSSEEKEINFLSDRGRKNNSLNLKNLRLKNNFINKKIKSHTKINTNDENFENKRNVSKLKLEILKEVYLFLKIKIILFFFQ